MNKVLPNFSNINVDSIDTDLSSIIDDSRKKINSLLSISGAKTWQNFIMPMEEIDDKLDLFWSPIRHLHSVKNESKLRDKYEKSLSQLVAYGTEMSHNKALYEAYVELKNSDEFASYDKGQQQVINQALRDFHLSGVDLPEDKKKEFAALSEKLAKLSNKFEQNLLDATEGWTYHVTDEKDLSGLPDYAIQTALDTAKSKSQSGWLFTLHQPSYIAVMLFADSREMRKAMYEAYVTRASDAGPNADKWSNSHKMAQILKARADLASLLNFKDYAEYSLATKMANHGEEVESFLVELAGRCKEKGLAEWEDLQQYAKEKNGPNNLEPWDVAYFSEKLKEERYQYSEDELREYFPLEQVLSGLYDLVSKLFGIQVRLHEEVDIWHPDVRFYDVFAEDGKLRGQFYLDLYARDKKRGGAWMDDCRGRRRLLDGGVQTPIAFLTCNFQPPSGNKPPLLSHDEVITLFHEFGHTLHHLLTQIDHSAVAGINGVPWDAVEFPSQFLEHWAWQKPVVDKLARHYKTNEPIPDELFNRLVASRNYHAAMQTLRQIEFALFDWRIHEHVDSDQSEEEIIKFIQDVIDNVRNEVRVTPVASFDRFQHGFAHIFSGGYAAGYYSYKWAEVLASDGFAKFEENGLVDAKVGREFLNCILERGGSEDPEDLFIEFRGRKPTMEALLRHYGISDSE